ncbi:MAG: hypothetical protein ACRDRL_24530 [Sciscionella sp.]
MHEQAGRPFRCRALAAGTVTGLRRHRRHQNLDRLAMGERWREGGRSPLTGSPAIFAAVITASVLPSIRRPDLRHGAVTLAFSVRADLKVVPQCSATPRCN